MAGNHAEQHAHNLDIPIEARRVQCSVTAAVGDADAHAPPRQRLNGTKLASLARDQKRPLELLALAKAPHILHAIHSPTSIDDNVTKLHGHSIQVSGHLERHLHPTVETSTKLLVARTLHGST